MHRYQFPSGNTNPIDYLVEKEDILDIQSCIWKKAFVQKCRVWKDDFNKDALRR